MIGTAADLPSNYIDSIDRLLVGGGASRASQHFEQLVEPPDAPVTFWTFPKDPEPGSADATAASIATPSARTAADQAISNLLKLRTFDENWDGHGAAKPSTVSLDSARKFIRSLSPQSRIPLITLHANGNAILFHRNADSYAEIEFYGDGRIGYYLRRGDHEWSGEDYSFEGKSLPEGFSSLGFTL